MRCAGRAPGRDAGGGQNGGRAGRRADHQGNHRREHPGARRRTGYGATLAGQGGSRHRQAAKNLTFTKASAREAAPRDTGDFAGDCARYSRFWESRAALLARLPAKPARNAEQAEAAEQIKRQARPARSRFLAAHAGAVYDRLTQNCSRFVRVEQLVYDAATLVPALVPTRSQVSAESAPIQRDKEGHE